MVRRIDFLDAFEDKLSDKAEKSSVESHKIQCRAIPYEGEEPFVFFSYCHKDAERVYPIIETLAGDGFRVWYDDGNHAGDEWPENIARHLAGCTVCIAMLSENAGKSHNCKSEVSFAIQLEKSLLPIKLEPFEMPLGMRLQLSKFHYLNRFDYSSDRELIGKLYESECLSKCRGTESYLKPAPQKPPEHVVKKNSPPKKTGEDNNENKSINGNEENIVKNNEGNNSPGNGGSGGGSTNNEGTTQTFEEKEHTGGGSTISLAQYYEAVLIRLKTREVHFITSALTTLGRAKDNDFQIEDEYVSSYHATVVFYEGAYYLRDEGSTNGTFIGKSKLDANQPVKLSNMSIFSLGEEPFMLIFGRDATALREAKNAAFLINMDTQCAQPVGSCGLELGRNHKWSDGTFDNGGVSRDHAVISFDNNEFVIEDCSTNGTYLDGKRLEKGKPTVLRDGARIRIVDYVLEFVLISV